MLFRAVDASEEEAHAHNEKQVGKDAANQRSLHNEDFVLHQSQDRYDELHSITIIALMGHSCTVPDTDSPESCIQQPAKSLPRAYGNLLCCITEHCRQWYYGDEVNDEDGHWLDICVIDSNADRSHDEKNVNP